MSDEYVGWGGVTPYTPYAPSPESNKRRANRARKQKSNNAAARKAAAEARRQQAAARKAARKLIAQQKKEQRLAKRAATRKRIEEHKRLMAARKAERQRQAEERRLAIEQKRAIALEHKLAREKARHEEKARRAADKALAELRKKTMGTGDCEPRVGIAEINNNLPYVEDETATSIWGIPDGVGGFVPLESEVVFDDIDNPEVLLSLGKERLEKLSKPQVSYEADVVALGRAGFSPDAVGVGDVVQIVDATFNPPIRVEGRVLKIEEDLLESVDATRITLGTIQETYTQRRASQQQKLDELIAKSSDWNTAADCENVYIHDLINRMNDILNARGGYTYLTPDEGIVIYDKPEDENPTKAIQLGGGFWRVADSLKPNGDWDWKNLADGSGIYANRIYTGILSDAVGKNYWNLDTGEFSLQASTKIGGKTIAEITNESLSQEAIFNKLTNNGQTQGIYLNGGHVYLNASYLRTGVITGARGKWDLDNGVISMWDKNGYETVHLDGDGRRNTLIGAFRTSLPGNYGVNITPDFNTSLVGDDYYRGLGAGITFTMPNHAYNAVVATEGESNDGKTLSSLWVTNGRVNKHDPSCSLNLKEAENDGKYAFARLVAYGDYDDKYSTVSSGMRAISYYSQYGGGVGGARLFSANGREECFVNADVTSGEICFNGALGEENNRNTFVSYHWLAMRNGMGSRQHEVLEFNTGCPAKYGVYYAVASSDTNWGQVNCHVAFTGRSSGWKVGVENNVTTAFDWPVYVNTFGWLVNRNMG